MFELLQCPPLIRSVDVVADRRDGSLSKVTSASTVRPAVRTDGLRIRVRDYARGNALAKRRTEVDTMGDFDMR